MTCSRLLRASPRSLLLLLVGCAPLRAQTVTPDAPFRLPVPEIVARFEMDTRARAVNNHGEAWVSMILQRPASPARRDSLLDALERLALASDDGRVQQVATSWIAAVGENGMRSPAPGVVPRLVRIYRHHGNEDNVVRSTIRRSLQQQEDRRAAAALLRSIAAEPDPRPRLSDDPVPDPRLEALNSLAEMGEEGRAVLQAMHRSGEARSPQARQALEYMAGRGFPVRDVRRPRPQR